MFDDGRPTATTTAQARLEKKLKTRHDRFGEAGWNWERELGLCRDAHVAYMRRHLDKLPEPFTALDASQTWITFWIVHSLALLEAEEESYDAVVHFLGRCQTGSGGFGGGPNQLPHLASTYAAVMALVTIGTPEALKLINREKLQEFLLTMCMSPEEGGGLTVHENGEVDVRGCYTAIAVAHVLNLDKQRIAENCGMVSFIKQCQSHEGGLGGEPGNEAHGGYTFCGLAALYLLEQAEVLNLGALMRWVVHMQGSMEGGFMGRTHKLVDGCYSYWQGAIFSLLREIPVAWDQLWMEIVPPSIEFVEPPDDLPVYDMELEVFSAHEEAKEQGEKKLRKRAQELKLDLKEALDSLVAEPTQIQSHDKLVALDLFRTTFEECQSTMHASDASFAEMFPMDSDRRNELPMHSIQTEAKEELYDAIGLQFWILIHSQMQEGGFRDKPYERQDLYHTCYCLSGLAIAQQYCGVVLGPSENKLREIHPILNVVKDKCQAAIEYFTSIELQQL